MSKTFMTDLSLEPKAPYIRKASLPDEAIDDEPLDTSEVEQICELKTQHTTILAEFNVLRNKMKRDANQLYIRYGVNVMSAAEQTRLISMKNQLNAIEQKLAKYESRQV